MRRIRIFFAWCFVLAALLSLAAAILLFCAPVASLPAGVPPRMHMKSFGAGALLLGALFGIAGWMVLRDSRSGGKWAVAASLSVMAFGLLYLSGQPHLLNPAWIVIAFGISGAAAFARPQSATRASTHPRSSSIPGDGTRPLVNTLVLVAGAAGGIGGVRLCAQWARVHGLPRTNPPLFVLQVLLAILLVLGIHEAGHAVAGMLVRMKLIGIVVGPFHWTHLHGRSRLIFRRAGLVAFGGQTMVAPTTMENFRNRKAFQIAGGPIASLLAGLLAVAAIFLAPGHPWAGEWPALAVFADITILVGLLNLVPFGNKSMYSDGAKLYQILSGGLWSRYHTALGMISSIAVTPLRPRDYDIAALEEATRHIARRRDAAFLQLCAYNSYLDSGRREEAVLAMEKSEASCREWAIEPPVEWCASYVYANAILRQDAAAARGWWIRIESRKAFQMTENLWTARAALLLSEHHLEEATAALEKAKSWTADLPATGSGEFERHLVVILDQTLRGARASTTATDSSNHAG